MHRSKDVGKNPDEDSGGDSGKDSEEDSDGDSGKDSEEDFVADSRAAAPHSGAAATRRATAPFPPPAPLEPAHWASLNRLLADMDDQVAEVYRRRGITDVRPRFVGPLILLSRHGRLTIRELAELTGRTHSALSQTVTALRTQGLVESAPGADARTRQVTLTARGRDLAPLMEAEWHATEEAVRQIEREIPYPLTRVVADVRRVLRERAFADRITDQLSAEHRRPRG